MSNITFSTNTANYSYNKRKIEVALFCKMRITGAAPKQPLSSRGATLWNDTPHYPNQVVSCHGHFGHLVNHRGSSFYDSAFLTWNYCITSPGVLTNRRPRAAALGTQDHKTSVIQGGSSNRTCPAQPVSLTCITRTPWNFGQCDPSPKVESPLHQGNMYKQEVHF